jgi:hypothetical protein
MRFMGVPLCLWRKLSRSRAIGHSALRLTLLKGGNFGKMLVQVADDPTL